MFFASNEYYFMKTSRLLSAASKVMNRVKWKALSAIQNDLFKGHVRPCVITEFDKFRN